MVRLLLAVLLPLHAGLAQAMMVAPAPAAVQEPAAMAEPVAQAEEMPCHHEAASPTKTDQSPHSDDGCCEPGSCHCAVACALPGVVARIAPQPPTRAAPFSPLSVPIGARPPDLRPPIG